MKTKVDVGFHAKRSAEDAAKTKHPNTLHFLIEVMKWTDQYLVYIATDCGDGEQYFKTAKEVNEEVARVRKTFVEKNEGWVIEEHGMIEVDE